VAFFGMTVWGDEGLLHLMQLNRGRSEILSENQRILKENLFYLEEIRSFKSVRYQEQKARSELGMIRQNETVFVVPEL
jgi:cell division protein FtsB